MITIRIVLDDQIGMGSQLCSVAETASEREVKLGKKILEQATMLAKEEFAECLNNEFYCDHDYKCPR